MFVGEVTLITIDNGKITDIIKKKNTLTNVGREYVAKLIGGLHTKPFKYIQIGKGTTFPTEEDMSLEDFYAEKEGNISAFYWRGYFVASIVDCTFSISEEVTISEAGLFDDVYANNPNMLARVVFSPREMTPNKSLRVRWGIRVLRS